MRLRIGLLLATLTFPSTGIAQDEVTFRRMTEQLATNARYKTPIPWEGSQRLQTMLSGMIGAVKDSVKKASLLEGKALSLIKHGNYDRAFADYESATQLNPKSHGEVGWRYLFLLRDYNRALTHLNAFDALTPAYDDPIDDYSVNYLKGRALAGLHQYEPAIAAYTIAIDNREQRYGISWVDYRYLVARAVAYLAISKADKALADLDNALKNSSKSTMAHFHRGRALQQTGRVVEARDAFQTALFFVRGEPFERDYYYEQPDAAYENQIEAVLRSLKE